MDIRIHSRDKHRVFGYYFKLIRDLLVKVKAFRPLQYADLFCGDGKCVIASTSKIYSPPIIDSILKPAAEHKEFSVRCFLNDLDQNKTEEMRKNTKDYAEFIEEIEHKDANEYYKEILKKIPPDKFSIFLLDPYNHSQLKWSTIKGISEHTHVYGNGKIRRPELVINLMVYTMAGSYMAKSYNSINESLGTDSWLKEIDKNKEAGIAQPIFTAFFAVFKRQLESLGYKVPTPIAIETAENNNPIYFIVWATNEEGYNIIERHLIPNAKKMAEKAHKEDKGELKRAKAGVECLEKWCEPDVTK
jgi:three-Cys-motif partner protein